MMAPTHIRVTWILAAGLAVVCLTAAPGAGFAQDANDDVNDPLETMNRGIFFFNEQVDLCWIEPFSELYDKAMPDPVQKSVRNAFDNVRFPIIFVNNLLQAKPREAGIDLARFLVNTTVGIGGLFDPASRMGLEANNEDFGQTLGYWGVPAGPYLVLPLVGPSSPRDGVGLAVDSAARVYPWFLPFWVNTSITGTDLVNRRSMRIEEIRDERAAAFDWYAAVRNAYVQHRENLVNDRAEDETDDDDDLYYPDIDDGY